MSSEPISSSLRLPPLADLTFAATLKNALEKALGAGTGFTLDASDVQQINSPCLQVLVSAVRCFAHAGGPGLTIASPSPQFIETASTLGLDRALGLTKV